MKQANYLATSYANELTTIKHAQALKEKSIIGEDNEIHVQTAGASLTELYESLRNASQNSESKLQLAHAILRFLETYFAFERKSKNINQSGRELIAELTMAGYLANDSIKESLANQISQLIKQHATLRKKLANHYSKMQVNRWTIQPLSFRIEGLLRDHSKDQALVNLAFNYFLSAIDIEKVTKGSRPATYEATLYMAVQRSLLGGEEASIRLSLLDRYRVETARYQEYATFNAQIDTVYDSDLLKTLVKLVNRNGAVFRIINAASKEDENFNQNLITDKTFLGPFDNAIQKKYKSTQQQIRKGIIRSIAFLIITKFIIGVAIEVPYDIIFYNNIAWLPLSVNLLLPPVYMALLSLTLAMPDSRNTKALHREAIRILYKKPPKKPFVQLPKNNFSRTYNFIYALVIIIAFCGVGWLLIKLAEFEWIHLAIFFVFISTASFLGFRLSRAIRSIEVGDEAQTSATILRDFIYMPFVAVGQKISETYSKVNIVSRVLDMLVELPLKTILKLLRRWGSFMSVKRDDL